MRDPGSETLSLDAAAPAATRRIATALAPRLRPGDVLALDGDLGAGKTLFTAALCEALGVAPGEVDSPSFVLLNEYAGAIFPLFHFDAYRLEGGQEELADAGFFDERLADGVCIVEWAQRLEGYLPPYCCQEITLICARVGCILRHTAVRDAAAKGKIERFFRRVRDQFLIRKLDLSSIEELNKQFTHWVEHEYNATVHSVLGMKPIDRFGVDLSRIRFLSPNEDTDEQFYAEAERSRQKGQHVQLSRQAL